MSIAISMTELPLNPGKRCMRCGRDLFYFSLSIYVLFLLGFLTRIQMKINVHVTALDGTHNYQICTPTNLFIDLHVLLVSMHTPWHILTTLCGSDCMNHIEHGKHGIDYSQSELLLMKPM